jgi:5-methylcytosine-specific restriction protein B
MLDNYLNDNAALLLARFPNEEDRAWAETVINAIKKRYGMADHWTAGGESFKFIDIRIGKKGMQHQKGWPVFYIRPERRNGPVSLLVNGLAHVSGLDQVLRIMDAPTNSQIDTWLDELELNDEGHDRLKGEGRNPVDYPVSERGAVEVEPGVEGALATHEPHMPPVQALNRILYGPPGTGKTYRTIRESLSIVEGTLEPEGSFAAQKLRFDALRREGRIAFVTFHQSFSYEDFIEGIRAEAIGGQLDYKVRDGIFKRMAIAAMYQNAARTAPDVEPTFDDVHDGFLEAVANALPYTVTSSHGSQLEIVGVNDHGNLSLVHPGRTMRHIVSRARLKELYEAYPNQAALDKKGVSKAITDVIRGANVTTYWAVLSRLLAFKEEMRAEVASEDGEFLVDDEALEYDQVKRRVLGSDILAPNGKPYVLIIDEINRGNMSRIFGELITLIEPGKRAGRPETAEVQLPYSNERFSVPDNLYVIGTMNTADRSLAMVDTALRRRFEFIEMMPDPDLLMVRKVEGVDVVRLLKAINMRIEHLYDREHMIGHSFFMGLADNASLADLAVIFRNNVLPLLEEYFYEDWEKISKILGKSGIYEKQQVGNLGFVNAASSWHRRTDKLMVAETYRRIYEASDATQDAPAGSDD